eukprot:EG_transcript_66680
MPTEILNPLTSLEYTFYAVASPDIDMATDYLVSVASPASSQSAAKSNAFGGLDIAVWPAGPGYFRISMTASTPITNATFAAAAPNLTTSTYANPVTFNANDP